MSDVGAAQHATRSIPIVTLFALDPVGTGFAQSLARPGGNVTGVLYADPAFSGKSIEILKEAVPGLGRLAYLYPTSLPGLKSYIGAIEVAARALGVTLYRFPVTRPGDIGPALAAAKKERVDALRVTYVDILVAAEAQVREFAAASKLPDFYSVPPPVERGGFMSYSPKFSDNAARAAALVDRILKGAKPAELPFEYPTRTEMVINLKTARERGIVVPQSILLRADRVIE